MTSFLTKPGRWFAATAVLLVIAIATAAFLNIEYSNIDQELKAERLHSESLFSTKVVLQKEIDVLKKELHKQEYKNKMKTAEAEELRSRLAAKEAALNSTEVRIGRMNEELQQAYLARKQIEETTLLLKERSGVQAEENEQLRYELGEIKRNESALKVRLQESARPRAAYFRIEALRGRNNKTTNKARKTDRILVSFTWPEASQGKNLYLVLSGPGNHTLSQFNKEQVSILLNGTTQLISPAAQTTINISNTSQRQDVILRIKEKLPPGVYQADVYTDDFHLGGTQIRLD